MLRVGFKFWAHDSNGGLGTMPIRPYENQDFFAVGTELAGITASQTLPAISRLDAPLLAPRSVPGFFAVTARTIRKKIRAPKLSDHFPDAEVWQLFSADAAKLLLARLKKVESRTDDEILARLNLNLTAHLRNPRSVSFTLVAVLRDLMRLGLTYEMRDNGRIRILPNPKSDAANVVLNRRPKSNPNEIGLATPAAAPRIFVYDADLIVTGVRSLLEHGHVEAASDLLFLAPGLSGDEKNAHFLKVAIHVLPALDYEETAVILSHVREAKTAAQVVRVLRTLGDSTLTAEDHVQIKLVRSLALITATWEDCDATTIPLAEILKELLFERETEALGVWLIQGAHYWGNRRTAEHFRRAFEAIPNKPRTWLDFGRVVTENRLRKWTHPDEEKKNRTPAEEALALEGELSYYQTGPNGEDSEYAKSKIVARLITLHAKLPSEMRARLAEIYLAELAETMTWRSTLSATDKNRIANARNFEAKLTIALKSLQGKVLGETSDLIDTALLPHSDAGFLNWKKRWLQTQSPEKLKLLVAERGPDAQIALDVLLASEGDSFFLIDLRGLDLDGFDLPQSGLWHLEQGGTGRIRARLDGQQAALLVKRKIPLSHLVLRGANLRGLDLKGAVLDHAALQEADFRGADLTDANLSEAHLRGARFDDAVLVGMDLSGVIGILDDQIRLLPGSKAKINAAILKRMIELKIQPEGLDLSAIISWREVFSARNSKVENVSFKGSSLRGFRLLLQEPLLPGGESFEFINCNFAEVDGSEANFSFIRFTDCDMRGANFAGMCPATEEEIAKNPDAEGTWIDGANFAHTRWIRCQTAGMKTSPFGELEFEMRGTIWNGASFAEMDLTGMEELGQNEFFKATDVSKATVSLEQIAAWQDRKIKLSKAQVLLAIENGVSIAGYDLTGLDFETGFDFRKAILSNEQLRGTLTSQMFKISHDHVLQVVKAGIPLVGYDLTGLDLAGLDLSNARFLRCRLDRANFSKAKLKNARFESEFWPQDVSHEYEYWTLDHGGAISVPPVGSLESTNFEESDLSHAVIKGSFKGARFKKAVFYGVNMLDWNLEDAHFIAVDLRGANLSASQLRFLRGKLPRIDANHFYLCQANGIPLDGFEFSTVSLADFGHVARAPKS